jgi:hypothetical protein
VLPLIIHAIKTLKTRQLVILKHQAVLPQAPATLTLVRTALHAYSCVVESA